jgi:ankyrin repeat protein
MVSLLIAKGADVNAADDMGYTPLFRAGTEETVQLLLDTGVDLHVKGPNGETVLDWTDNHEFDWKSKTLREHIAKAGTEF